MAADYVFVNGDVVTVNPNNEVAEAVAVEGGRILAVGTTAELTGLRGPRTRVVDLEGRSLLPGFIDSHLHMLLYGTNRLGVDCKNGVGSVKEMVDRLTERAAETPGASGSGAGATTTRSSPRGATRRETTSTGSPRITRSSRAAPVGTSRR